jgi:hypothetical protein
VNSDLLLPGYRRLPVVCPSKMHVKNFALCNRAGPNWQLALRYFRSTSINRHRKTGSTGPFRAHFRTQEGLFDHLVCDGEQWIHARIAAEPRMSATRV